MDAELTLRQATRKDAPYILQLEEEGMRCYAQALWGGWTASSTPEFLPLGGHEMIEINRKPVGCVACELRPDHMRVKKLYVSPEYRGNRIGARILATKFRHATVHCLPLRLTVLSTNKDAMRFYLRQGMSVIETTPERITLEHR